MKKLFVLVIFVLFAVNQVDSQVVFSSPAYVVCPSSPSVTVSLLADNFTNMSSLSLEVNYDPSSLMYISISSPNPALSGGFMQVNAAGGTVFFAWFSTNLIFIQNGDILFNINFSYITDSSYLSLYGLTGAGTTSMVIPGVPQVTQQPSNLAVANGGQAQFSVGAQPTTNVYFQWQMSANGGNTWMNIISGSPFTGVNSPVLSVNPVNPNLNGYLFRCQVISCLNTVMSNPALLTVASPASLLLHINYQNAQNTNITNTAFYLMQAFVPIYTFNTGTTGTVQQANMIPGVYDVLIDCQKPWGGGNAVDALLIMKHFTGLITLSGMGLKVADVDNSGAVNSVDALLVLKRFVGIINSFPAPDWQYDTDAISIAANGMTNVQIKALCSGDVDGSYVIP